MVNIQFDYFKFPFLCSKPKDCSSFRMIDFIQASLVAQECRSRLLMQEMQVQDLGQEDAQEKEMATLKNSMDIEVWQAIVYRIAKSQTRLSNRTTTIISILFKCQLYKILSTLNLSTVYLSRYTVLFG